MLKLLKYELKKRANSLITFAIILCAADGLAIYLISKGKPYMQLGIFVIGLMFFSAVLMAFLDVATQYYNDFKKSQGTLLFLTPNNGYKIVGSKMIFGALELFTGMGLVILLGWIANVFAVSRGYEGIVPKVAQLKEMLAIVYGSENIWLVVTGFFFLVFLQYFTTQSIAISSITLGRTILSKNQYNWLYAVLIFLGVIFAVQFLNGAILVLSGMGQGLFDTYTISGPDARMNVEISKSLIKIITIAGIEYVFWIVASFFVSSTLLNKKIDI